MPARPTSSTDRAGAGPGAVGGGDGPSTDALPEDVADLQHRALTSAMAAYTAAHGHAASDVFATDGRRRWGLRSRAALVAAAMLLALGGVVVARSMNQAPSVVVPDAGPGAGPGADPAAVVRPEVVVHVVGEVAEPGLVRLPEGSRVADAIDSAGGASAEADLGAVNLARVLVDGEQVVVPRPGDASSEGTASGSALLDLNTADAAALDALPGVGPVLAQRIVDWRTEHGAFTVVDELAEVTGIGPAVLTGVRDLVRVG